MGINVILRFLGIRDIQFLRFVVYRLFKVGYMKNE